MSKEVADAWRPVKNLYCWDDRHSEPCDARCPQCQKDCPHEMWEDSPVNRERAAQWEARKSGEGNPIPDKHNPGDLRLSEFRHRKVDAT